MILTDNACSNSFILQLNGQVDTTCLMIISPLSYIVKSPNKGCLIGTQWYSQYFSIAIVDGVYNITLCHLFQPQQALVLGELTVLLVNVVIDRAILSKFWVRNFKSG